jgi:hypothetical protein
MHLNYNKKVMTRVLRSASKKAQPKADQVKKLSVSKKSKVIRNSPKKTKVRGKDQSPNPIWNISPVMSTVFSYIEHKDLITFNTVCKKWNQLTSPIVHRSIKLLSAKFAQKKLKGRKANKDAKVSQEIKRCIDNNSKFAPLVKEFNFSYRVEPKIALQFFEVFKFIKILTIKYTVLTHDHFLAMIDPLKQLEELNLFSLTIKKIVKNIQYTQPIKLPQSLTKLAISNANFIGDVDIFTETINSHTNLKEFIIDSRNSSTFLIPFYNHYPSLEHFEFSSVERGELLFKVFEANPQLRTLKIRSNYMSDDLTKSIGSNLVNLEELRLDTFRSFFDYIPTESLSFCKPTKLKKLEISIDDLKESSLTNILNYCSYLDELRIHLPQSWKGLIKVLRERSNLKTLHIIPSFTVQTVFQRELLEELNRNDLYSTSSIKNTLTNLTINSFKFTEVKPRYFKEFGKLKYIKFSAQWNDHKTNKEIDKKTKIWKGYTLKKLDKNYWFDIELIKN